MSIPASQLGMDMEKQFSSFSLGYYGEKMP